MQIADERGWQVVRVWGDLDLSSAPRVRAAFSEAIQRLPLDGLVADLAGVDVLDSTGIGVLIGGLRRARQRAVPFALLRPPDHVRSVLALVGLDAVFTYVAEVGSLSGTADGLAVSTRIPGGTSITAQLRDRARS